MKFFFRLNEDLKFLILLISTPLGIDIILSFLIPKER